MIYLHGLQAMAGLSRVIVKLKATVMQLVEIRDEIIKSVGASIAAAVYPPDGSRLQALLNIADARMYEVTKADQIEQLA